MKKQMSHEVPNHVEVGKDSGSSEQEHRNDVKEKEGFAQAAGEPYEPHASAAHSISVEHPYETCHNGLAEKSYTTQASFYIKRGHGIVRERCLYFINHLKTHGYECITLEQAQDIFSHLLDNWDRLTLQAYFGTQEERSTRFIDRYATYARTGTTSLKTIKLTQKRKLKKGYLEKLDLVHYEKRGSTWFLILNESALVPEIAKSTQSVNETAVQSIDNLSLTLRASAKQPTADNVGNVDVENRRHNITETEQGEERECIGCEINWLSESNPNRVVREPFNPNLSHAKPLRTTGEPPHG